MSSVPSSSPSARINLDASRYDQSSYEGRVRHFLDVIDPLTLIISDKELNQSLALLDAYRKGTAVNINEEQLWHAKKIKDAIIHPDTNEKIFAPFRFSAFVPMNIPIVVGMLSAATPASNIFWQWTNQSYNVAVNYANRNASNNMSIAQIGSAYAAAVVASCSLSIGLKKVADKIQAKPSIPSLLRGIASISVPYIAVASAGAINVLLMRGNEAQTGIQVKDGDGEIRGVSKIAGKEGLIQVAATRVALPAPILLVPPVIMSVLDKLSIFKSIPRVRAPTEVAVIAGCLWAALPAAIGLFPQTSSIKAKDLEPEFHQLKDKSGKPVDTLYFNKGL